MTRKILLAILLVISSSLIIFYGYQLVEYFFMPRALMSPLMLPPPPPPVMGLEAGPIKVILSEETPWASIIKLLSVVLGTYLGIKLINKYVK